MKKIILVIAAVAVVAGAYAQNDSLNRTSPRDLSNNQNQNWQNHQDGDRFQSDGVVMRNGKMMKLKNGQMTILHDNDMTLSNGTKIMSDGTCIHKDGTKTTMKEGQHMDMSGHLYRMETNYDRNRDFNQSRDLNQNRNNIDESYSDGVSMQNGKVMQVKNGQTTILNDNELTMTNGTRVMRDGTWIKSDGTRTRMEEGQHMDMSGKLNSRDTNKDNNMYLVPNNKKNDIK